MYYKTTRIYKIAWNEICYNHVNATHTCWIQIIIIIFYASMHQIYLLVEKLRKMVLQNLKNNFDFIQISVNMLATCVVSYKLRVKFVKTIYSDLWWQK